MPNRRLPILCSIAGIALLMAALESLLPADAFFVGDSGVKLIAAREVLDHPTRPFEVDPPRIGQVTFGEFRDPFFVTHGGHAHPVTSPVFPALSAPFLALFGLRGLMVLPILGFVASVLGLSWMAGNVSGTQRLVAIWVVFALSPLFFYGLEFWEHACAAGAAYLGTGLWLRAPESRHRVLGCGALIGLAIILRPEAIWYAIGVAVALPWLPRETTRPSWLFLSAGLLLVVVPLALFNVVHFHNAIGLHAAANVVAFDRSWAPTHWSWFLMWLAPTGFAAAAIAVAFCARAFGAVAGNGSARLIRLVVLISTAALATLAAWRRLPIESWWTVFPSSLLLASVPWRRRCHVTFLAVIGLVQIVGVLATAPNDSAQWGPRYLLLAGGPLAICVWQVMSDAWRQCRWPERGFVVLIVVASLGVQRLAFKELRAAKQSYSALQRELIDVAHGEPILTDVWWLDQETSAYGPPPIHLFASGDGVARTVLSRLAAAGVSEFVVVTAVDATSDARVRRWCEATAFQPIERKVLWNSSFVSFRLMR